jgi:hypothetical protein
VLVGEQSLGALEEMGQGQWELLHETAHRDVLPQPPRW